MKLFLKRDVSVSKNEFTVFDELGNEKYFALVKGRKPSSTLSLRLLNTQGEVTAKMRRIPIVGTNTYLFSVNKKSVTMALVKNSAGFYCYFYGNNWHIHGDVLKKSFDIIDVDKSVVMTHRQYADYSELEIFDETNELFCVCASICANMINTVEKHTVQMV